MFTKENFSITLPMDKHTEILLGQAVFKKAYIFLPLTNSAYSLQTSIQGQYLNLFNWNLYVGEHIISPKLQWRCRRKNLTKEIFQIHI